MRDYVSTSELTATQINDTKLERGSYDFTKLQSGYRLREYKLRDSPLFAAVALESFSKTGGKDKVQTFKALKLGKRIAVKKPGGRDSFTINLGVEITPKLLSAIKLVQNTRG